MKLRHILFLRDVCWYTLTAFGGPQAHLAMMLKDFVKKRTYITETELLELNALTQVLPGPSSTQTLIGIAYKVGGLKLAVITFIIWLFPSAALMSAIAISYSTWQQNASFAHALQFIQPIAIGIVAFAGYSLARSILKTSTSVWLAVGAALVTLILRNAYVFPIIILLGGIITSALDTHPDESQLRVKLFANINRQKVLYFLGILVVFASIGAIINRTSPFSLPVRLFENFYRNGIMVFGGGQVLVPLMYTEFVEMKHYLTSQEFLTGYAFQQALPGPTFSFTSFVGAVSLKNYGYGISGQIVGSIVATLGINLPGMILVLFIVPFWNDLKKIARIKNSLSGINAVSVGFLVAAFILLAVPVGINLISIGIVLATFLLLTFTSIRTPYLIVAGILLGFMI